jgi:CRP/FNR family transcriptional regulator, cyclic AMP receptor protein
LSWVHAGSGVHAAAPGVPELERASRSVRRVAPAAGLLLRCICQRAERSLHLAKCINTLSEMHPTTDLKLDVLLMDEEYDSLKKLGSVTNYPAGSILMGEGEDTTFALLIQSGHVKIVSGLSRRILAIRGAGEFVGEMAAIRRKSRSASVFALGDVQALHLPGAQWLDFMINNPRVAMALLRLTEERLAETTKKTVESALGTRQKLANALLELELKGLGIKTEGGTLLRFSQADLANIAGISIDSAKQGIKVFKEKGLVQIGRQTIVLKNRDEVAATARGDSTVSL